MKRRFLVLALVMACGVCGQETYRMVYDVQYDRERRAMAAGGDGSPVSHNTAGGDGSGKEKIRLRFEIPLGKDPLEHVVGECERGGHGGDVCELILEGFVDTVMNTTRGAVSLLEHRDALAALFGMKGSYESFAEAAEAGRSLENFEDVASWWKFQEMMGDAASRRGWPDYRRFAEDPLFHFVMAWATWGDPDAARLAAINSPQDAVTLLKTVGDSPYGYREGQLPNHSNGALPTSNTCRHAMHITALLRVLREKGESRAGSEGALRHMTFVEIGGGYGNMARMVAKAYGFKTWTILDLGFMGTLQRNYLEETLGAKIVVNGSPAELRHAAESQGEPTAVNLVDTKNLNIWYTRGIKHEDLDVLVATSSLSELAMNDFFWYFNHVVKMARYILYAYNKTWPSPEIVEEKLSFLLTTHTLVYKHESASGSTVTCVLEKIM